MITKIFEFTSATGGLSTDSGSVSGGVPSSASGIGGQTLGISWASHGGCDDEGNLNIPYNPSGANRTFYKIPFKHKNNTKIKRIIDILDTPIENTDKVMNYDDFILYISKLKP